MKDNEFMDLLNLYLDHEISEADAARLEAEVQRNPARYRVYREYCQMHKACTLLSPAHASEAPVTATLESRTPQWKNPFAISGFFAAAACAALLFLNRTPTAAPVSGEQGVMASSVQGKSPVPEVTSGAAESPRSIGRTVTVPVLLDRSDVNAGLATRTLRWNSEPAGSASAARDARFDWIESLQLTSMHQGPVDALRFETKPIQKDSPRSFSSGQLDVPSEYNAIQFQR